jgi:hypothetical protein
MEYHIDLDPILLLLFFLEEEAYLLYQNAIKVLISE